ncbi:MAG: hypothetical protein Q8Q67_02305 [bacterium]|nr:hypothetical protein [bacterium]
MIQLTKRWASYYFLFMAYFQIYGRWYNQRQRLAFAMAAYWRYLPNRWYLFFSLGLQLILWFFAYRMFSITLGDELFVYHYNVDFGIDAIGEPRDVFRIPLIALSVLLVNWVVAVLAARREHFHFLSHAFGLTSILAQVLGGLALMSLYLINFLA